MINCLSTGSVSASYSKSKYYPSKCTFSLCTMVPLTVRSHARPPKAAMVSQDESLQEAVQSTLALCEGSVSESSGELSVTEDIARRGLELWERKRATLLLRIFSTLDATQRTCLGGLLSYKAKVLCTCMPCLSGCSTLLCCTDFCALRFV